MTILEEVEKGRKEIRTDDYAMSVGEWVSMYESGDLDIHPEFQRFFRWTDEQKSNLVESILLGIPLPPIFVSQRDNGVWDVIDGLQRLSTIFQLMGIFIDHNGKKHEALKLSKTKYIPSLEGATWDGDNCIPSELKRILRRSKLSVSIILRESDENTKYDLFERLNTGGTKLSNQEVRNCILVMVNQDFYDWIRTLAEDENFVTTTALSEKNLQEAYDTELVLRFLLFVDAAEDELKSVGDVGVYLSTKMVELAKDTEYNRNYWESRFRNVFKVLAEQCSDSAFKRYSTEKQRHEGGFVISQYEAVTAGTAALMDNARDQNIVPLKVQSLWEHKDFTEWAKSGITASRRLRRIVPFSRRHFTE
jgi:hypothetical protein